MDKQKDITPDERILLSRLKQSPWLYLEKKALSRFMHFYNGYYGALITTECLGAHIMLPEGFYDFVAMKYDTTSNAGCFHIILGEEQDEEKAFDIFFELLDEYLVSLGYDPIPVYEK